MSQGEFLGQNGRVSLSTILIVVVMAVSFVARSATGETSAGTRITNVSLEQQDAESTVIAVSFDGPISGYRRSHIGGEAPRAVVKLAGIVEAYRPYEVAVDDGRVLRVRIGHHPEFNPSEEHLVFDLVDDRVAITRVIRRDRRLTVVLGRVESTGKTRSPAPGPPPDTAPTTAAAEKFVPPTPTATATKTATKTATTTPTTTPRLDPTVPASPPPPRVTATPASPLPVVPPRPSPTQLPATTPRAAAPDRRIAPIPTAPSGFSGPLLTELVISHRGDGSALVRVTADGPIEGSDVAFFGVRDAPPRYLLVLPGTGLPGEDGLLPVLDGLLCEIDVVFITDDGPARTELTFYLAASDVTFKQAGVKGSHTVIHLLPPAEPKEPLRCEVENRVAGRSWRFVATGRPQEAPISDD